MSGGGGGGGERGWWAIAIVTCMSKGGGGGGRGGGGGSDWRSLTRFKTPIKVRLDTCSRGGGEDNRRAVFSRLLREGGACGMRLPGVQECRPLCLGVWIFDSRRRVGVGGRGGGGGEIN